MGCLSPHRRSCRQLRVGENSEAWILPAIAAVSVHSLRALWYLMELETTRRRELLINISHSIYTGLRFFLPWNPPPSPDRNGY